MIDYIKGSIEAIDSGSFVVETGGIGFRIESSSHVTASLNLHSQATVYTHLNVREDDMSLFGFLSRDEVSVFRMLIGVSGIGPKGALSILSELSLDELRLAVLSDDHKAIAKANGIGPKTAQKIILELRDKMKLEDAFSGFDPDADSGLQKADSDVISETAMALTSLGYSNVEALRAIKRVKDADGKTVEELLKLALKNIM